MKPITPGLAPDTRRSKTLVALERYPGIESSEAFVNLQKRYGEPVLAKGYDMSPVTEVEVKAALAGTGSTEIPEGLSWFIITTDQVDRANDRVIPKGMRIRNFASNPVILWSHDSYLPAIGRGERIITPFQLPDGRTAILLGLRFHDITETARNIGEMVRTGWLKTGSIGFIPLDWKEESVSKYPEAYPFTDTVRSYVDSELLEFSICNIPMNTGATLYSAYGDREDLSKIVSGAVQAGVLSPDAEIIRTMGLEPKQVVPGAIPAVLAPQQETTSPHAEDAATKSLLATIATLNPIDMDIDALAEKAGLTPEQFTAALNAVKEAAPVTEGKSLTTELAKKEAKEQMWNIDSALWDLRCDAMEKFVEGGDSSGVDNLPMDYADAANRIVALIKSIPVEDRAEVMRSLVEWKEKAVQFKAGSVLNAANKDLAKQIYKDAGICNKSIGNIFEAAKALLDNAGVEGEEESVEDQKQKAYDDDAPLIPATDKAVMEERLDDLESTLTRVLSVVATIESYTKPATPSDPPVATEAPNLPVVDLSAYL